MIDNAKLIWEKLGVDPSNLGAVRPYKFNQSGLSLLAGQESVPQSIRFRKDGVLFALSGCPDTGAVADYAGLSFRLQFQGQEEFITNGDVGAYAPMLAFFSPTTPLYPFPRPRLLREGTDMTVYFRNGTLASLVPSLVVHTIELVHPMARR